MKKILLIIISIMIVESGNLFGQNNKFLELANETIENFNCSVNAQNFKYYGLSSEDDLNNVKPGDAIVHYAIGLRSLMEYTSEQDPYKIIKEMGYVTVPLYDKEKGNLVTFVMLSKEDENYHTAGIGQAPYSLNFMELKNNTELGDEANLIRIPALNIAFLGISVNDTLNLIRIIDKGQKNIDPLPATQVFTELAEKVSDWKEDVPR